MKFAVGLINFFDNELEIKVVEVSGKNWKDAFEKAFPDYAGYLSDDMKEAKREAFDADFMFDVVEV